VPRLSVILSGLSAEASAKAEAKNLSKQKLALPASTG
jgi:hypothetical protein